MWNPKDLTRAQKEERRLSAAALLEDGRLSQAEIAREMNVSAKTVCVWAGRLESGGREALKSRLSTGRPPRMRKGAWTRFLKVLEKGARASGYPNERWTLPRIQTVLAQRLGVSYAVSTLGQKLHRSGWSPQKPQVVAQERSDELAEAWIKKDWPRIKKSLAEARTDRLRG